MSERILSPYETDTSRIRGLAKEVFRPTTIHEVRDFVMMSKRVVPRGGGSGFVGGSIPLNGEDSVIDLSKLDRIGNLDVERKTVEVDAGVILFELQEFLKKSNLEFPIDIESRKIATIGGMIATNAFGSRVLKYKKMENWIKWIEVIDSTGNISKKGATELTDYVGLEGISGIIVRACLKLESLKRRSATLVSLENIESVVALASKLKRDQNVSAIDFFDKLLSESLGLGNKYNLVVEYEEEGLGKAKGEDYDKLMKLKNNVYFNLFSQGYNRVEDFKLLVDRISRFSLWLEERGIPYFGHLSIGLIHPVLREDQEKYLPEMIKFVRNIAGHLYPKHGIGLYKKELLGSVDKKVLENVKKRTDVLSKFNISKVI